MKALTCVFAHNLSKSQLTLESFPQFAYPTGCEKCFCKSVIHGFFPQCPPVNGTPIGARACRGTFLADSQIRSGILWDGEGAGADGINASELQKIHRHPVAARQKTLMKLHFCDFRGSGGGCTLERVSILCAGENSRRLLESVTAPHNHMACGMRCSLPLRWPNCAAAMDF